MKEMSGPRTALIQALVEEHQHIKDGLSVLEAVRICLDHRNPVSLADLMTIVRFFSEYADKIHHHNEEELLFPAIEQTSNRRLKQMQGKLGTQHVMGRLFVGEMKNALKDARAKRRGWRSHFVENAKAFQTLLTVHICDENHLYFPLAEKILIRENQGAVLGPIQLASERVRWEKRINRLYQKHCPAKGSPHKGGLQSTCSNSDKRS